MRAEQTRERGEKEGRCMMISLQLGWKLGAGPAPVSTSAAREGVSSPRC